ncbi:MAG TPA: DUF4190 domain-containing protein [Amycolatopsis sp.]|uniref:DUF4190 domain-containing protein n=1 Tax=Amycolatopsis sp. TaxID=37632 RepID=UPI002B471097|nr:DUF4190 domain-containing protein [Amycolatopsis sp.]HKS46058.1 DUF4190 domain-containing protein [Amycolatopsis sp.]
MAAARNAFGLTGFVLGLLGLVSSFVPAVGAVAWPLVILGIIFAGIGLARVRRKTAANPGPTIAGLALSVTGLVVCLAWLANVANPIGDSGSNVTIVRYDVSGTAQAATITYSASSDGHSATGQEYTTTLPWSKDIRARGQLEDSSLTISTGADGGNRHLQGRRQRYAGQGGDGRRPIRHGHLRRLLTLAGRLAAGFAACGAAEARRAG